MAIPRVWAIAVCLVIASAAAPGTARAGDNDLVLSRLGFVDASGEDVVGSNLQFRALASELGVALAPRLTEPADTLGFGGFQFSADLGFTSINDDEAYWRALEGSPDPENPNAEHGDGFLPTVGLFVRKGIWLPLPSFEMGLGAVHLIDSRMWAAQGYAKFALHEGYHDLPLPSVAVRGGASRVMGSSQLDLTIASIDVSLSKDFGIAGTTRITPYAGWNWLIIVPRSEVVDKTPHIDSRMMPGDSNMNFVFKDQDDILRNKLFFGAKIKYYVFVLGLEAGFAFAGTSTDDRSGTDATCERGTPITSFCDSPDISGLQSTFVTTVALDF